MKKALLIDPFSGASGDMMLGALVDAGYELELLRNKLRAIPALASVTIDCEKVERGMFAASRLLIRLPEERTHRGLGDVREIIETAPSLEEAVKLRAISTFSRLAEAEARVHGVTADDVHFHEVGALDAIVDVVGFHTAVADMGIASFRYTSLVVGSGKTDSQHGEIPLPAPATLELLQGHPVEFSGRKEELITPTAAAIVASGFEPLSSDTSFTPETFGYGAGTRDGTKDQLPNILRIAVGRLEDVARSVSIVRTTIDDMNPEVYGYLMERLFREGALEVYYHPVTMKKNRPGVELTVIAQVADEQRLAGFLMEHTTTLGVRICREDRVELERRQETIRTEIGEALVKIGTLPGGGERMSPEFESCKALAETSGLPIVEVYDIVRNTWRRARAEDDPGGKS
jgi:uncharacterized protein (TIGR00299 family) protein